MGAHSVVAHVRTNESLEKAWEGLYLDSRSQYGSDPYSGTFATCSGVVRVADLMSVGEAELVAEEMFRGGKIPAKLRGLVRSNVAGADGSILRGPEKRGAAYAIPVCATENLRTKTRMLTVDHETSGYLDGLILRGLIESRLDVPIGSWISKFEIVEDKVRTRKTVERSIGKRTTTWVLFNERGELAERGIEYATEREAIKAAEQILHKSIGSDWRPSGKRIEVRGILRRDGQATKVEAELAGRRTKISYQLNTTAKAVQGGWFFFGWAAS